MRKKLFAILMSAMMMVTFMPTMAFAAPAPSTPSAYDQYALELGLDLNHFALDKKASDFGSCTKEGTLVYKCKGHKVAGKTVKCDAVQTIVWPGDENHTYGKVKVDLDDMAAYLVGAGIPTELSTDVVALLSEVVCKSVYVKVCTECGELALFNIADEFNPRDYRGKEARYNALIGMIEDAFSFEMHSPKAECQEYFTCTECGRENCYNFNKKDHKPAGKDEVIITGCTSDYIMARKCELCGEIIEVNETVGNGVGKHSYAEKVYKRSELKAAGLTASDCVKVYVHPTDNQKDEFVVPSTVVKAPTCTEAGEAIAVCTKCGAAADNDGTVGADTVAVPALGHTKKVVMIPATCYHGEEVCTICSTCGRIYNYSASEWQWFATSGCYKEVLGSKPLEHDYEVIVKQAPTCNADGITVVRCKRCEDEEWSWDDLDDYIDPATMKFEGFRGELGVAGPVIADWSKLQHKWGSSQVLAAAGCETPEYSGQKCELCGSWKNIITTANALGHDKVVEEIAATCEHKAGKITTCTRCDLRYVDGLEAIVGGKCKPADEWTTTIPSTFTKVGTRVKLCTVCGAECEKDDIAKLTLGKAYMPKLTAGAKKLTVKIATANKNAQGYQIAYKVAGNNNWKFVKTTSLSKTIKSLKKGAKYAVKVRPYAVEEGKTFYGKYCTIKYVKVK